MAKVLIEWVSSYGRRSGLTRLPHAAAQATGFVTGLGVTPIPHTSAEERHFEDAIAAPATSGEDTLFAERAHIAYFSGHGDENGPRFVPARTGDGQATQLEMRLGDGLVTASGAPPDQVGLKWLVLDACRCLKATLPSLQATHATSGDVIDRWGPVFHGLHYVFGFRTSPGDEPTRGRRFATYLRSGSAVRDAWVNAVEETEPTAAWAYLRASSTGAETYDERLDAWTGDPSGTVAFNYVTRLLETIVFHEWE